MSAGELFFVDTNLLVYSVDPTAGEKHVVARQWMNALWASSQGRLSWQVLNEFYSVALRKKGVSPEDARAVILPLLTWQPAGMSANTLKRAWNWMDQAQYSYWDALIVATAEVSGCRWLLTEDLQDQRSLDSVTIVNPFRVTPGSLGLA